MSIKVILKEEITNISETMYIDDWGRLHDEDDKVLYPYKKIEKFILNILYTIYNNKNE